jgi:hypothetical protein
LKNIEDSFNELANSWPWLPCQGYGGPAFMPQGMAVGFFLATAIRASFAGVEKKLVQRSTGGT